jgi:nucleoside-diphosphate-sugar epimerase
VVTELLANGHQVLGLARSDASAAAIAAAGGEVRRGEITDLDILSAAAAESDGVVHLAFRHDVAFAGDFETAIASNQAAIETIGEALAGSDKPFAVASGLGGVRAGEIATEDDRPEPTPGAGGRVINERTALALAERGVRSMAVRFAPTVHGAGDHGFVTLIVAADHEHGAAAYVGDGNNRWPAVHVTDAARLVRIGLENAPAARYCTRSARRASPSATSPRRSDAGSSCPRRRCRPNRQPSTSGSSAGSSPWTCQPPARTPANSSAGNRPVPD